jgi:hypothetical protein
LTAKVVSHSARVVSHSGRLGPTIPALFEEDVDRSELTDDL